MSSSPGLTDADRDHLRRVVALAREALETGDGPFGSVLVGPDGSELLADHNREVSAGDETRHPEFEIARWAATHLDAGERAASVVYTSTEHCPMCAAAHAWVGLGPIVYASSSAQVSAWRAELGGGAAPVRPLPIGEVAPGVAAIGPVPPFDDEVRELHRLHAGRA